MIKIEGDKSALYQWDLNRRIILTNIKAGVQVHFSHEHFPEYNDKCPALYSYEEDGNVYANVPNIFLQKSGIITVYIYIQEGDKAYTEHHAEILVLYRPKPADYIYTETEVWTAEKAVEKALQEAKESGDFTGPPGPRGPAGNPAPQDAVRYNTQQALTDEQKACARGNIDAVNAAEVEDIVTELPVFSNSPYANAIKGTALGSVLCIDDVSPSNNKMLVKASVKNLFVPNALADTGTTTDKITYTRNRDNTITFNGKSSHSSDYTVTFAVSKRIDVEAGIYTLSGCASEFKQISIAVKNRLTTVRKTYADRGDSVTFQVGENEYIEYVQIVYSGGLTFDNYTLIPQIEKGTVATAPAGAIEAGNIKVRQYGKNLLPYPYYTSNGKKQNGINVSYGSNQSITIWGTPTFTSGVRDIVLAKNLALPTGDYTISGCVTKGSDTTFKLYLRITKADGSVKFVSNFTGGTTFTISDGDLVEVDIRVGYEFTGSVKYFYPQIEIGNTATEYEPYKAEEYIPIDGKVTIEAYQPNNTLLVNNGAVMEVSYNKDSNKVIENLIQAIISLGGNI